MQLTKYEEVRILGARALQISMGAPLLVKRPDDVYDPVAIAELEMEAGKVPITIHRPMPEKMGPREEKTTFAVVNVEDEADNEEDLSEEDLELYDEESSEEDYGETGSE